MKIALFGGSFNPPHIGHIMIAQQVLDFCPVDEVWFLPSYGQSPPKDVAPVEHRLAMVKLLSGLSTGTTKEGIKPALFYQSSSGLTRGSRFRVSTIEIDNKLDGETVHILPYLPEGNEYSFIIGSDQLAGLDKWLEWEKLLDAMHFWIFPRYGYPTSPPRNFATSQPVRENMTLVTSDALMATDISSTKIRARVKLGLDISHFVPPAIALYVKDNNLYL